MFRCMSMPHSTAPIFNSWKDVADRIKRQTEAKTEGFLHTNNQQPSHILCHCAGRAINTFKAKLVCVQSCQTRHDFPALKMDKNLWGKRLTRLGLLPWPLHSKTKIIKKWKDWFDSLGRQREPFSIWWPQPRGRTRESCIQNYITTASRPQYEYGSGAGWEERKRLLV